MAQPSVGRELAVNKNSRPALRHAARVHGLIALLGLSLAPSLHGASFELVSGRWDTGKPVGGNSLALSASGRYAVFSSISPDIVNGDTNGVMDVFLRDRETGTTTRVSVSSSGAQANGPSADFYGVSVTPDGRYVSFYSLASNLVPGDTNNQWDVFVRDTAAGTTERVSVSGSGAQANDGSYQSYLSDDGRYVLFNSAASNLIASQSRAPTAYVRDRLNRTTRVVGLDDPTPICAAGGFSADGTLAAFTCGSAGLYVRNLTDNSLEQVSYPHSAEVTTTVADLSANGRYLAFTTDAQILPADTNGGTGWFDAYLYDSATHTFDLISANTKGVSGDNSSNAAAVSDDGRYVAFSSWAKDIEGDDGLNSFDAFVRDRLTKHTVRVSRSVYGACCMEGALALNGHGTVALFSSDGRYVADDFNNRTDAYVATNLFAASSTFTVQPRTLSFGTVSVGTTSAAQSVTITNTGSEALAISWIGLAGTGATQFVRVRHCPATLAAGGQCTATVAFAPTTAGAKTARLVVSAGGTRKSTALAGTAQ
jgi:Tol biopolymer transport system component